MIGNITKRKQIEIILMIYCKSKIPQPYFILEISASKELLFELIRYFLTFVNVSFKYIISVYLM